MLIRFRFKADGTILIKKIPFTAREEAYEYAFKQLKHDASVYGKLCQDGDHLSFVPEDSEENVTIDQLKAIEQLEHRHNSDYDLEQEWPDVKPGVYDPETLWALRMISQGTSDMHIYTYRPFSQFMSACNQTSRVAIWALAGDDGVTSELWYYAT